METKNKKYDRIQGIFFLTFLLIISTELWAATDRGDDGYIIKKGDTLWDISSAYLKDPFLWPKIWKENKYILDPDLIYPGNRLNIPGLLRAEAEKTIMETAAEEEPPAEVPVDKDRKEEATRSREKMDMTLEKEKAPLEKTLEQIVPEKLKKEREGLSDYIIPLDIDGGSIVGSKDNRDLLADMDRVYINAPKGEAPIAGDSYLVIRKVKTVIHPKTRKPVGNLVRVLGIIKIVDVSESLITADIVRSKDYITKGDRLIRYEPSTEVPPSPVLEKTRLRGYIVEARDGKEAIGQFDIVYIDRGRGDGVSPGDSFIIYRDRNKNTGDFKPDENIPNEMIVGRLLILSAQEKTSTAEIIRSSDTIEKGYIIERVIK